MAEGESGLGYAEKGDVQAELERLRTEIANLRAEVHRLRFHNGEPITPSPTFPVHPPYGGVAPGSRSFMPGSARFTGAGGGGVGLPNDICIGVAGGVSKGFPGGGGSIHGVTHLIDASGRLTEAVKAQSD